MASNVPTNSRGGSKHRARAMQVIRNSSKKKVGLTNVTDKLSETKRDSVTSPNHKSMSKTKQEQTNASESIKLDKADESPDKETHPLTNQSIKPFSLIYCNSNENKPPYCVLCNLNLETCTKEEKGNVKDSSLISNHVSTIEHINKYKEFIHYSVLSNLPSVVEEHYFLLNNYIDSVYVTRAANTTLTTKKENVLKELREILLETSGPDYVLRPVGSSFTGAELRKSDLNLELVYLKEPPGHFSSRGITYPPSHTKLINPDAGIGEQINHHVLQYDLVPNAMRKLYDLGITMYNYSNVKQEGKPDYALLSNPAQIHSKVPRLVLSHLTSQITVEICSYIDSSQLSRILRWYLDLDFRAKKLSIFMKSWALITNFNNPNAGSLPPYAYVLIVIHYLQRTEPPILPCIHKIVEEKSTLQREFTSLSIVDNPDDQKVNDNPKTSQSSGNQVENSDGRTSKERLRSISNYNDSDDDDEDLLGHDDGMQEDYIDIREEDEDDLSFSEEEEEEEEGDDVITDEILNSFTWSTQNKASEAELLIGLFKYLSVQFEHTKYVLSIRTLEPLTLKKKKWKSSFLAIEDPTRPSLNISRAIATQKLFNNFFQNLQETYRYLSTPPVHKELNLKPGAIFQDTHAQCFIKNENGLKLCQEKLSAGNYNTRLRELVKTLKISVDFDLLPAAQCSLKENFQKLVNSKDALFRFSDIQNMKGYTPVPLFCLGCRGYHHINENCTKLDRTSAYPINPQINALTDPGLDALFITNWESSRINSELASYHELIVQQVASIIQESSKLDCKLELFGSAVNGLGQRTSDLDICMTINNNPTGKGLKFVKILKKIVPGLESSTFIKGVVPVLSAKVPIIKFQYIDNRMKMIIDVDLSMYNQCACYNTKLIKSYCDIDYRVAILCFVVRTMVKACGVCEAPKGSLSSYAWTLLVIHFLQRTSPPVLPCLQELYEGQKPIFGVSGWNVWFYDDIANLKAVWNWGCNNSTITKLYLDFLDYYSNFDFLRDTITIRTLRPMPRSLKRWNACKIAIEDPFELTWNLGSRVDDRMACFILNVFPGALAQLCLVLTGRAPRKKIFDARSINNKKSPPNRGGCHKCGQAGHLVRNCPTLDRQPIRLT